MAQVLSALKERGERAVVLLHEGAEDRALGARLASQAQVPLLEEADPQVLKGLLALPKAVVGSRFHALVSALCQGVPSLGTGWSHKYEALFQDYDAADCLLPLDASAEGLEAALDLVLSPERNGALRSQLSARGAALKAQSQGLWEQLFQRLDPVAERNRRP